jgi:hypothetical protein
MLHATTNAGIWHRIKYVSDLSVCFGILQNEVRRMRKRQTFLLTVISPENGSTSFCGRLKNISSGEVATFTNLNELYQLLASEMDKEGIISVSQIDIALDDFPHDFTEKSISAD